MEIIQECSEFDAMCKKKVVTLRLGNEINRKKGGGDGISRWFIEQNGVKKI